jgi:anthranilate phosphoribosyltransferase
MSGQNVTINDLTAVAAVTASMSVPVMDAGASDTSRATMQQVREYVGVIAGTGAPTATTYTHPTMYLRSDGTATNDRAYITTSTGGWVAFITAS